MNIKVIGIGGIGCALLPVLTRYLNFSYPLSRITLIDGDSYEDGNKTRQVFDKLGNKAEVSVGLLSNQFEAIRFETVAAYIDEDNVYELINDGDIVFLGVDNHATRLLVSDRCEDLDNITLISGGNEMTTGNVQIYIKLNGEDITLPISNDFHPEIMYPEDVHPGDMSCGDLAYSSPQLVMMNNAIASVMLNVFYSYLQGKVDYDEVYVDILTGNARSVQRKQGVKL